MSDTTKIVLGVMGAGAFLLFVVAIMNNNQQQLQQNQNGFTPAQPGAVLPAQDAGAEAVRGGFSLAGQIATIFAAGRAADAAAAERREERDAANGFSWTASDRERSAADLAAKNGSVSPR